MSSRRSLAFVLTATATLAMVALPSPTPLPAQSPAEIEDALQGLDWREIGPANMGGRVTAITGIPGDPKTFWIGGADGGVWKTTDGGVTFEGQRQDAEAYSVGALTAAPSDHNVVWLGSGEGDPRNSVSYGLGVWRTTDGGESWEKVLYINEDTGCSDSGEPSRSGARIRLRISTPVTTRGPDRLK